MFYDVTNMYGSIWGYKDYTYHSGTYNPTNNNTGRTSSETRPKNITVEIYKYEPL